MRHNTAHPVLSGTLKWLIRKLIRHFRNEKEMEPKLPHTQTSLFRCARKGGLRPPSVPFPSSLAVHHQSLAFRARLRHAKNEAPEEELEPKCVPQLFLGLSFGTCGPAIVFSLSLVTIPEVFAKLSWFLKPSIPLRSSLITNLQL